MTNLEAFIKFINELWKYIKPTQKEFDLLKEVLSNE